MNHDPASQSQKKSMLPMVGCVGAIVAVLVIGVGLFVGISWMMAQRQESLENLKKIGLALHNYHDTFKAFPYAHFDDDSGTPRCSWRAALLPYIEEGALYEQYEDTQMWNSEKNLPLSQETPAFYRSFFCDCSGGKTPFKVIVDDRSIFPDDRNTGIRHVTDGTSNVILIVADYENPVTWSEPVDLTLDEFLTRFAKRSDAVLHVVKADGGLAILHEVPIDVLRNFAQCSDGQLFELSDYEIGR